MTPENNNLAWHFLPNDGHTANGEHIQVVPGQTVHYDGRLELCAAGYHFSRRILDALRYAPGFIVERVQIGGDVLEDTDKGVASDRTCLWLLDAKLVLLEFACRCAEYAFAHLPAGMQPDPRSIDALRVIRDFCAGKATQEDLEAAYAAANAAANAANAAARAANAAARAAAYAAADAAACADLNALLETMIEEVHKNEAALCKDGVL